MSDLVNVDALEASVLKDEFYEFFKAFWDVVVPDEYVENWHIPYLCGRMQAVAERVFGGLACEQDLVVNVPPGTSKPVWEETPVMMHDGTWKPLREVKVGDRVIGKSGHGRRVSAVHIQGNLSTVRFVTRGGRKIVAAPDHPVLTADGWKNAGDIKEGDRLALMHRPRHPPVVGDRGDDEFAVAGYLIGDGSVTSSNLRFTNSTPEYLRDYIGCAKRLGWGVRVGRHNRKRDNGVKTYNVDLRRGPDAPSQVSDPGCGRGKFRRNGPHQWARDVGLKTSTKDGLSSRTKHVLPFVWRGTNDQVARFLACYFHCDGNVSRSRQGTIVGLKIGTVSERLAYDVQKLFLRLGINMRVREDVAERGFKYNRTLVGYKVWTLYTYDQDEVAKFAERIPILGYKQEFLRNKPRTRFEPEYLPDEVAAVEDAGVLACRCLTVSHDASFVADGVVVHNSTVISVMFPAWVWTRMPGAKIIGASYSYAIAMDLARKCRDVVKSEKYRRLFPGVRLRDDQDTKGYFMNTAGGYRYAVGTMGSVTGMHGHFLLIDDPLDPEGAGSDLDLATANRWITNTLGTRKTDKRVTPTVLVMQRLRQGDPTDEFLRLGAAHVKLPAEAEDGPLPAGLKEEYGAAGLLDARRLPREVLEKEKLKGQAFYSAQYRQHPVPPGGLVFHVDKVTRGPLPEAFKRVCRCWDKAGTAAGKDRASAYTVGAKVGIDLAGRVWVLDVIRERLEAFGREQLIRHTAEDDGPDVLVGLEQEPGSGGKESAQSTVRNLMGFLVEVVKVGAHTGGKEARADPLAAQMNAGNVYVPENVPWFKEWEEEFRFFPRGRFKDQVDATSLAFTLAAREEVVVGGLGAGTRSASLSEFERRLRGRG